MVQPPTSLKFISSVCDVLEKNFADVEVSDVVANDEEIGGRDHDHVFDRDFQTLASLTSKGKVPEHGGHCVRYLAGRYIQLRPLLEEYQTSCFSQQCSENIRLFYYVSKVQ
jgi:hypothetical protein